MSGRKKPPARPERTARRESEREATKLVRARQRLAELSPGGAPDRPIVVPSSSVIETRAASQPCPLCEGDLRVEDHAARTVGGIALRVLTMVCRRCGVAREVWFRIGSPLSN